MENRPASDYAKMYIASKKAIQSVNPNIPVVGLNTSGAPYAWIEEVLKAGATNMDVLSVHPYQWYGNPFDLQHDGKPQKGKKMFEDYGMGDIPIWITEYGYSSHYEEVNTDIDQGMYNAQSYAMIMQEKACGQVLFFYCFLDKDNAPRADRESNFGMVRGKFDTELPYTVSYAAKTGVSYHKQYEYALSRRGICRLHKHRRNRQK
ncbi:MAG: glycosyl hydrolase [Clostridiales bacterium]|nr:MAG: glycosyl hydrolase [Clostridiales bacterium]